MYFSFELIDVKCNAVLSSSDSPWGKYDGIRIYFLVFTGNDQKTLLVSGREFPEPDIADNFYFYPGKTMALHDFPPQTAPSWESDLLDVNEGDNVWCAVIGVNEGLPYLGGGGGGIFGKLGEAAIKTYLSAAQIPISLDLLDVALDSINSAPECRGVAFAYELVFSARYLFANYFKHKTKTLTLNSNNSSQGLQIISRPKSTANCSSPSYEINLRIVRQQQPSISVDDKVIGMRDGLPRPFTPTFTLCVDPDNQILVWPVLFDREITFSTMNFFLPTITIWQIEGQDISAPNGAMTFSKEVSFPANGTKVTRSVNVTYNVSTVGRIDKLILKNDPADGNYSIKISLLLKFFDNQPPLVFYEDDISVMGQIVHGNQAYVDYLNCIEHFRETVSKYARRNEWVRPGTPVEALVNLEQDLFDLTTILSRGINIQNQP